MPRNHNKINKTKRSYSTFNYPDHVQGSKTLLTGIRECADNEDQVFITGFYEPLANTSEVISFVYKGDMTHGLWYDLNYPSSPGLTVKTTNLYGPDSECEPKCKCNKCKCKCNECKSCSDKSYFHVVGNYTTVESGTRAFGCLYQGSLKGFLPDGTITPGSGTWITLLPPSPINEPVINTIAHSTINGLVVGNYDTQLISGKAFIYDIEKNAYYNIIKHGAQSITAYGIWYNEKSDTYTICGGYTNIESNVTKNQGYLVDWNNRTLKFSGWKSFNYGNDPVRSLITHFDGITSDGSGGYNLTGDRIEIGSSKEVAFFANVKRKCDSKFSKAKWESIDFPGSSLTSGNSVYQKTVIGVYAKDDSDGINGYISM